MRTRTLLILIVAVAAGLAACGGSDAVSVDDAWGRPSPTAGGNAAFYMVIHGSEENDALISAATDACGATELHESSMSDGVMSMQQIPEIPVVAGATVTLEPGGLHVMCLDVGEGFAVGDTVDLSLTFEVAGEMDVTAEIREGDDMSDDMGDHDM